MPIEHGRPTCGPRALAALLGSSHYVIADQLVSIQRAAGRDEAPGTPHHHMTWVLHLRGYDATPYDVDADEPRCTAAEHLAEAQALLADPPPAPPAALRRGLEPLAREWMGEAGVQSVRETQRRQRPHRPTVAEWIERHPEGMWLVQTIDHVLAVIDGEVVAGDEPDLRDYHDAPVHGADLIERRTTR